MALVFNVRRHILSPIHFFSLYLITFSEPTYEWLLNNRTVIRGNALIINTPVMRNDSGRYTCVAFNKHGRDMTETYIDVQCKITLNSIKY